MAAFYAGFPGMYTLKANVMILKYLNCLLIVTRAHDGYNVQRLCQLEP
jgi:hypothetical protein